ncbi:MAG TPA: type II secretion system protein GspG, partial [Candidatus Hydrogenedentes bacterium]|nr:type II secretion system protein GspG [Candidatus Hydrogenedentota bacterium]
VVAIMATLATVASLFFLGATDDADIAKARTEIKALKGAVTQYMLKNNRQLPNSLEEVAQYMDPPKIPKDPWGNNYIYQKEGSRKFVIMSYGADGAPGGEGVDGDISSNERSCPPRARRTGRVFPGSAGDLPCWNCRWSCCCWP